MLSAPEGYAMRSVVFASYGTPYGECGSYQLSSCNALSSMSVMNATCSGKNHCAVSASNAVFGEPCEGNLKNLRVEMALGKCYQYIYFIFITAYTLRITGVTERKSRSFGASIQHYT